MSSALYRYYFVPCLLYSVWSQGPASLTFNQNPVYKGSQLAVTCNFSTEMILMNVTLDAFNGTRRAGSLFCSTKTNNTTAIGVFSEERFAGCPSYTPKSGTVNVSMEASLAFELMYNCTVTMYDDSSVFTLRSNSTQLEVKDPVLLAFSDNPVYNGSQLTITCSFHNTLDVTAVTIEAFSEPRVPASQCYCIPNESCNCTGVFSGSTLLNHPALAWRSCNVSVFTRASPTLELKYSCTIRANVSNYFHNWTSDPLQLQVRVWPSRPKLTPEHFVFNESQCAAVLCQSHDGKPPADLNLTVTTTKILHTSVGNESVSVNLSLSRSWHNAVVLCNVTNYNMTAINFIVVNHLAANGTPDKVYTYNNDSILDCSSYIVGFPEPTFQWSVPLQLNLSYVDALNTRYLLVGKRQSGIFNCTATSLVTGKNVTVTFTVLDAPPNVNTLSEGEIVGAVIGSLAALATIVFMTVIIKRRRHSKFISRLLTSCLDPKKSEPPANPSNVYVQATGSGFATVTGDAVEYSQSLQPVYSVLGENRGEAGDVYSSLDKTYQNNAFSD